MSLRAVRDILRQARDVGTVTSICFEGGEPFLYYPIMLKGVQEAAALGFRVGLVTNAYWATDIEDALAWLRPLAAVVESISISSDVYHEGARRSPRAQHATEAARRLGISLGVISVAQPDLSDAASAVGQLPAGESAVMYRGRAADNLVAQAALQPWETFTACPYENLRAPGRLHVDPLGHIHICQGISLGNLFQTPLRELCDRYDPASHPITGPLLQGGPAELARRYGLTCEARYADACHLCYAARRALRQRFPDILAPDQMYGVVGAGSLPSLCSAMRM